MSPCCEAHPTAGSAWRRVQRRQEKIPGSQSRDGWLDGVGNPWSKVKRIGSVELGEAKKTQGR